MSLFGGLGRKADGAALARQLQTAQAVPSTPAVARPLSPPSPPNPQTRTTTPREAARAWQRLGAEGRAAFARSLEADGGSAAAHPPQSEGTGR